MKIEILTRPKRLRGWDYKLDVFKTHEVENELHAQVLADSARKLVKDAEVVGWREVEVAAA